MVGSIDKANCVDFELFSVQISWWFWIKTYLSLWQF